MQGDRETESDLQPSNQHLLTGTNVAVLQAKNNNRGSRDEPRFSRHIIAFLSVAIFILASVIGLMPKKILKLRNIPVYLYLEFKRCFFDHPWQFFWFSTNSVQMRANVEKKKWMRLDPGITSQTKIIFTMKITPLYTLMTAVPGKCIMISNPDVFQCVNLRSFSLGTKLSFHWNKKLVGKGFKRNCTMGIYS